MIRKITFVLWILTAGIGVTEAQTFHLYYPIVEQGDLTWTGIAVANPNGSAVNVRLTLYDLNGNRLTSAPVSLGANQQQAYFLDQVFGVTTGLSGWVEAVADQQIAGFVILGSKTSSQIAGIQSVSSAATTLDLAHIAEGGGWSTTIAICNIQDSQNNVRLTAYDSNGNEVKTLTFPLSARQQVRGTIKDLFRLGTLLGGHLEVTSDKPVVAAETFANQFGMTGVTGIQQGTPYFRSGRQDFVLNYPLVVIGPTAATGIAISNPSSSPVVFTITLRDFSGNVVKSDQRLINGKAQQSFLASEFVGSDSPASRWIQILSNGPLDGFEIYGNADFSVFSGIQAVNSPSHTQYISHIAEGAEWRSWLSLINYSPGSADVSLTAFGRDGSTLGTISKTIPPFGQLYDRLAKIFGITTQLGGQIHIQSDSPLLVGEFFDNGLSQAGVSGQPDINDPLNGWTSIPLLSSRISTSQGGTLEIPLDPNNFMPGLKIQIPPGALSADTDVGINLVTGPTVPLAFNQTLAQFPIEIQPDTLVLQKPITITIPLTQGTVQNAISNNFGRLSLRHLDQNGWSWVPINISNIDQTNLTITGQAFGFGTYSCQMSGNPNLSSLIQKKSGEALTNTEVLSRILDFSSYPKAIIELYLPGFLETSGGESVLSNAELQVGAINAVNEMNQGDYYSANLSLALPFATGLVDAGCNVLWGFTAPSLCTALAGVMVEAAKDLGTQLNSFFSSMIDDDTLRLHQQQNWYVAYRRRRYSAESLNHPKSPPSDPFCGGGWLRNPNNSACTPSENLCLSPLVSDFPCFIFNPYKYNEAVPAVGEHLFRITSNIDASSLTPLKKGLNDYFQSAFSSYIASSQPIPSFVITQGSSSAPNTISVDAGSSKPDTITSYSWDFGDTYQGSSITGRTASHTYVNSGTYNVKLTVQMPGDPRSYSATQQVIILPPSNPNPPVPGNVNPHLTINPLSGPVSQQFSVTGEKYTLNGQARVHIVRPSGAEQTNVLVSCDANGSFLFTYQPQSDSPVGAYTVWATDITSGLDNDSGTRQLFAITPSNSAPSISEVVPSQINAGQFTTLSVRGNGFDSNAIVRLRNGNGSEVEILPSPSINHINASSLAFSLTIGNPGSYTIEVQNPDAQVSSTKSLVVSSSGNTIVVNPESFTSPLRVGDPPSTVPIQINNGSSGTMTGTIVAATFSGGPWLTINGQPQANWIAPATIPVTLNPAGLAAGTYTGNLTVTSGSATNSPKNIGITFIISSSSSTTISVFPMVFQPRFIVGDPAATLGFRITSSGGGFLAGAITANTDGGGSWLTIAGHSSYNWSAPETVNVTANPAGLLPGTYTGSLTATSPNASNSVTIPVTMTISSALQITTASLPDAIGGQPYNFQLQGAGGSGTGYVWSIQSGNLPVGLSLNVTTGVISGTPPVVSGSVIYNVNIGLQDSASHFTYKSFSIVLRPGLAILPYSPSNFQFIVGLLYSNGSGITFQAAGGTPPYRWSATGMPPGLSIVTSSGEVSGTPTQAGTFSTQITVSDSNGQSTTQSFNLVVVMLPLVIADQTSQSPPVLPPAVVSTAYNQFLQGRGGSQSNYRWSIQGTLPPGITSQNGPGCPGGTTCTLQIVGTPTQAGSFPFTVTLTDSLGTTVQQVVTLIVNTANPPQITTSLLPKATLGQTYSTTLTASGGSGSGYQWVFMGNSPDGGIQLSPTGVLSGTPTVPNDCISRATDGGGLWIGPGYSSTQFQVKVTDSSGHSSIKQLCLVSYYPTPQISSFSPDNVTVDGLQHVITVNGANFRNNAYLYMSAPVPTTYVNGTTLSFTLYPGTSVAFTTSPGGSGYNESSYAAWVVQPYSDSSNQDKTFSIYDPPPVVNSVTAVLNNSTQPCTPNLNCQLVIKGSGFVIDTTYTVVQTGQRLVRVNASPSQLPYTQVTTSAFSVSTPGTYTVQVTTPNQAGGGSASTTAQFTVTQ